MIVVKFQVIDLSPFEEYSGIDVAKSSEVPSTAAKADDLSTIKIADQNETFLDEKRHFNLSENIC